MRTSSDILAGQYRNRTKRQIHGGLEPDNVVFVFSDGLILVLSMWPQWEPVPPSNANVFFRTLFCLRRVSFFWNDKVALVGWIFLDPHANSAFVLEIRERHLFKLKRVEISEIRRQLICPEFISNIQ